MHVTVSEEHGDDRCDEGTIAARCSKLVCVDLAGSERVKESGVSGVALKEAQAINLSLFHLIRVVACLDSHEGSGTKRRVPYADS